MSTQQQAKDHGTAQVECRKQRGGEMLTTCIALPTKIVYSEAQQPTSVAPRHDVQPDTSVFIKAVACFRAGEASRSEIPAALAFRELEPQRRASSRFFARSALASVILSRDPNADRVSSMSLPLLLLSTRLRAVVGAAPPRESTCVANVVAPADRAVVPGDCAREAA